MKFKPGDRVWVLALNLSYDFWVEAILDEVSQGVTDKVTWWYVFWLPSGLRSAVPFPESCMRTQVEHLPYLLTR